jgi:hypothetical protein
MGFVFISGEKALFAGQVPGEKRNYDMHPSRHRLYAAADFF